MRIRTSGPSARIEMTVLLLGATGAQPSFRAWRLSLNQVGVPFEAIALRAGRSQVSLFGTGDHPRFQALTLATGALFDTALSRTAEEELDVWSVFVG